MSRTVRTAWTAGSALILTASTMLMGFVATPLLLRWLGHEVYGSYRVITDSLGYLSLFDFGVVGALIACLGPACGRGDPNEIRGWLRAGMRACAYVSGLMLVFGLGLTMILPGIVKSETISGSEIRIAGAVLLIPFLLLPLFTMRALVELRQMGYLANSLLILQAVLSVAFTLTAAYRGYGLIGQAVATVAAQLPAVVILTVYGTRQYWQFWKVRLSKKEESQIWRQNWQVFTFTATSQVGLVSDNLCVSYFLGPAAVTAFFITQRLATIARGQLQSLATSTWAGMLELWAKGEEEIFRSRLLELTRMISGLGVLGLGIIAIYNGHFVVRWVGAAAFGGVSVTVLAAVNCWIWSVCGLWHWPIAGTGNIGRWTPYAVASMLVNITLSIVGTYYLGLAGPLLGTLAGFLFVHVWAVPRLLDELFQVPVRDLYREALEPFRWAVPYLILVWSVAAIAMPTSYLAILSHMAVTFAAGLLLWWSVGLPAVEKERWRMRIRLILGQTFGSIRGLAGLSQPTTR